MSRWETGETTPPAKTLSSFLCCSMCESNTLLGAPRQLICQCCDAAEDAAMSREPDGAFNEEYCKWCYADGEFRYTAQRSSSTSAPGTWRASSGRPRRCARIWRLSCPCSSIGK
ncbi:MAG: zinc ribbon domain-containing protein [Christensenellaceae bacterium]